MSERFQAWLLKNRAYKAVEYVVNERLGKRSGLIGRFFRALEMGERQYSRHAVGRNLRVINYFLLNLYQTLATMRPVLSRVLLGVTQGPLNYSGIFVWVSVTAMILSTFHFIRARDVLFFNYQDNPEFWFARYNMMFPPSYLHNRLSAHYIEINHIFAVEMLKRYQVARKEIIDDREQYSA